MKLKFSQGSKTTSQQGFSMLETMVAALVSLIFMSLGANLVLAANLQKVVAKRNIAMNNFIQSDLEAIKYQANFIAQDNSKCSPTNVWQGYGGALKDKVLNSTSANNNAVNTTNTVQILNQSYTMTRTIEAISSTNNRSSILPIYYTFRRTGASATSTPDHQLYVELIPNAALVCT
jgi:type II secretory pathway pseudopilin PulG